MKKKVIIIGAGISGLATAFWLEEKGYETEIIDKNPEPGGAMLTVNQDGFLIDFGPNSGLETTPLIRELAEKTDISDKMIYANEKGNNRYILRGGEIHALPTGPVALIKTKLFSFSGKLRIMREPFVGRSAEGYYQSLAEFVRRRLGKEFLDYAINPFVSGVFAGDPEKLSVASAFPKLYRLEEVYGGLIKGMILGAKERKKDKEKSKQSAKMFSFKDGMQSFPIAISNKLRGVKHFNSQVNGFSYQDNKFSVRVASPINDFTIEGDAIFTTVPAFISAEIFKENFGEKFHKIMSEIYYPPVLELVLGYKKSDIGRELDGFGFLIPEKERKDFLGAIWSSTIFEGRAPEGYASFTLFVGGAKVPDLPERDPEVVIEKAITQFSEIMRINAEPSLKQYKLWNKAIPQYNLGYIEIENMLENIEKENKGFFFGGNYTGGISVGDCVKNSGISAEKIDNYLKS